MSTRIGAIREQIFDYKPELRDVPGVAQVIEFVYSVAMADVEDHILRFKNIGDVLELARARGRVDSKFPSATELTLENLDIKKAAN